MRSEAPGLKAKFEESFWMDGKGFFAEALDKDKKQVDSITTNPGHCLWSGLIEKGKAGRMAKRYMEPDMNSGWGIRTLSTMEKAYDPQSYHDGSIWPHDNSLVAWGLKSYGYAEEANQIITSLIDARSTSTTGCRNCSAATRGRRESRRSFIIPHAARRPGHRAASSCSSRPCWGCTRMRRAASST
jgi:glycogen debranching enzyme